MDEFICDVEIICWFFSSFCLFFCLRILFQCQSRVFVHIFTADFNALRINPQMISFTFNFLLLMIVRNHFWFVYFSACFSFFALSYFIFFHLEWVLVFHFAHSAYVCVCVSCYLFHFMLRHLIHRNAVLFLCKTLLTWNTKKWRVIIRSKRGSICSLIVEKCIVAVSLQMKAQCETCNRIPTHEYLMLSAVSPLYTKISGFFLPTAIEFSKNA